jgi:hypothetical protein
MMRADISALLVTVGVIMTSLPAFVELIDFLDDRLVRERAPAWSHAIGNAVALVLATSAPTKAVAAPAELQAPARDLNLVMQMRFFLVAALICGMTAFGVSASWAQRRSSSAATGDIARTSQLGTAPASSNVFGLNPQRAGTTQISQGIVGPAPCPGGSSNDRTLATFDGGGMMVPSFSTMSGMSYTSAMSGTSYASTMPETPSASGTMSGTSGSDACGSAPSTVATSATTASSTAGYATTPSSSTAGNPMTGTGSRSARSSSTGSTSSGGIASLGTTGLGTAGLGTAGLGSVAMPPVSSGATSPTTSCYESYESSGTTSARSLDRRLNSGSMGSSPSGMGSTPGIMGATSSGSMGSAPSTTGTPCWQP